MSKKSFVKGAAILAAAGLLSKFIGAMFRIPLVNIIGSIGIGYYQMAYPIYSFLLIVSTAGIPTAISKMVAENIALGNYRDAHRVFRISVRLMLIIGLSTFIVFSAGSRLTARIIGAEEAIYSILAIAPSLVFVTLLSSFRGYFQGMQYMTPTALSQIIEQLGKLLLGLWFASIYISKGPEFGAAAAVAGVTLSEGAALALVMGMYRRKKGEIAHNIQQTPPSGYKVSNRSILSRLILISFPITIGASIMPLISVADSLIVVNRLVQIGFGEEEAKSMYGLLTGNANPLINFPAVLTIALAMSLVPAVSESFAGRDHRSIAQKTETGIRLTLLIGLPAAAGMAILARPVCALLYGGLPDAEITATAEILAVLSIGVVFLTLVQTLTAILQGLNRMTVPVRNLAIGAMFKIALTWYLIGIPEINVKGAAVGTIVCYGVAALLDLTAVIRYSGIRMRFGDFIVKPVVAVFIMSLLVYFSYGYLNTVFGSNKAVLLAISLGVIVYAVVLLAVGAVNRNDLEMLPGGVKLGRVLSRLKLIR
ncbi:MAG: putative polysaccharide biosynthesis protein [Caldicoprobacterales bacterium]|jgi:stage V sporulation protein B|nr:polysaccharide biosynthesis protein [Clostridiales bacterium]